MDFRRLTDLLTLRNVQKAQTLIGVHAAPPPVSQNVFPSLPFLRSVSVDEESLFLAESWSDSVVAHLNWVELTLVTVTDLCVMFFQTHGVNKTTFHFD